MKYTRRKIHCPKGRSMKNLGEFAALVLLIVAGVCLFQYREQSLRPHFEGFGSCRRGPDSGDKAEQTAVFAYGAIYR